MEKEFNLSEKRKEMFEAVIGLLGENHPAIEVIKTQIKIQDKEFIKWCETHSHISDGVQVIAISKLKEGVGNNLL